MLSDKRPLVGFLYNDHKEIELRIKYGNGVSPYLFAYVSDRAKYGDGFHPPAQQRGDVGPPQVVGSEVREPSLPTALLAHP